jgi:multicomponent Na+:H+ antiporter subunit G
MVDVAATVFLALGAVFVLIAAVGAVRFPDVFMRMHAATKAGTLGAAFVLLTAAMVFASTAAVTKALLTFLFLLLTAPVAAHVLGRAAYYDNVELWDRTRSDALRGRYPAAPEADGTPEAGPSESSEEGRDPS